MTDPLTTRYDARVLVTALLLTMIVALLGNPAPAGGATIPVPVPVPRPPVPVETSAPAHPPRVTPDAAERRYASCMTGAPRTPRGYEVRADRCRERVAAGRL
ncbi:hypothetical protein NOK12_08490 [Nocardioides sp. OK12]|uniref:hypothetical protein n=1 Tax=Nocardioides sp. OK12 TaxID=2758661 RepID=UPI0021C48E09|nr:hypothetical protein [Nocardioides sp. OK12]GHJ58330.1 hypothetical protein NOK12_08490 [Nocardioides sp. OK12]